MGLSNFIIKFSSFSLTNTQNLPPIRLKYQRNYIPVRNECNFLGITVQRNGTYHSHWSGTARYLCRTACMKSWTLDRLIGQMKKLLMMYVTAPDIWSKRHLPRRIPARLLKFRLLTGTFRWWFPIGIARLHVVDSRSYYPTSIKHTLNAWSDWIFWGWLAQLGVPLRRRSLKITEPLPVRCQSMVWKPSFFLPHLSSKTEQTHNMTQWRNAPVLKGSETYTFNLFSPQLWRTTAAYWT